MDRPARAVPGRSDNVPPRPWAPALDTFADLPPGNLSADGRVFATPHLRAPSGRPAHCVALAEPDAPEALTLFFAPAGLVAAACSHTLRPKPLPPPEGMIVSTRRDPFLSRFLTPYIRLRKRPTRDLTSVYRSAAAWHWRLGPLDATAWSSRAVSTCPRTASPCAPRGAPTMPAGSATRRPSSPSAPSSPPGFGKASLK
jgi:hypothetical protein